MKLSLMIVVATLLAFCLSPDQSKGQSLAGGPPSSGEPEKKPPCGGSGGELRENDFLIPDPNRTLTLEELLDQHGLDIADHETLLGMFLTPGGEKMILSNDTSNTETLYLGVNLETTTLFFAFALRDWIWHEDLPPLERYLEFTMSLCHFEGGTPAQQLILRGLVGVDLTCQIAAFSDSRLALTITPEHRVLGIAGASRAVVDLTARSVSQQRAECICCNPGDPNVGNCTPIRCDNRDPCLNIPNPTNGTCVWNQARAAPGTEWFACAATGLGFLVNRIKQSKKWVSG